MSSKILFNIKSTTKIPNKLYQILIKMSILKAFTKLPVLDKTDFICYIYTMLILVLPYINQLF